MRAFGIRLPDPTLLALLAASSTAVAATPTLPYGCSDVVAVARTKVLGAAPLGGEGVGIAFEETIAVQIERILRGSEKRRVIIAFARGHGGFRDTRMLLVLSPNGDATYSVMGAGNPDDPENTLDKHCS